MVLTTAVGMAALVGGFGCLLGVVYARLKERALRAELANRERDSAERHRNEAASSIASAREELQAQDLRRKNEFEQLLISGRAKLEEVEQRLVERETSVNRQLDRLGEQEATLHNRTRELDAREEALSKKVADIGHLETRRIAALEKISGTTAAEARAQLLQQVERECSRDAADLTRHILAEAKHRSEEQARRIVAVSIQRIAGKHTFETTTATVALTGEDMKGRIIGRDGRNIRAFEAATGVTVLVDDTPNAVVLSGFDPVRREIARQAMERLMVDGRIHPARIEEVTASVSQDMETLIGKMGDDAAAKLGLMPLHPEVAKVLGKLYFRHSFAQNVLDHSMEVAQLCGLMAAEMGEDIAAAKRSGLLHDIGKAITHEHEGPHAIVGADFLRQHGEGPVVVNAVASHHDEVPHETIMGILVSAADAISASRPGARSESMTTYLKRLENLERIAMEFEGVERAFAVQAGRELRVIVRPEMIDESSSLKVARSLARRVEEELHYPGQIRITLIRETRCVEYAK